MNDDGRVGHDLSAHPASNLDALHADLPEKLHVGFPLHQNVLGRQASRNLADVIYRRGAGTMHVAAHFSFDQGGAAANARAREIALRGQMDCAMRANGAAETRGDFVIAQIDVRAALRADRRGGRGTNLLFRFAIETFDDGAVVLAPETFQLSEEGWIR